MLPNARLRRIFDEPAWTGYEVVMDVWPEVFSFGVLGVPRNMIEGERRPAVVLQHGRSGLPLKASRFSVLLAQHQQILRWLGSLPYVDANRIGFYGLSWGGQSALYLPALLDGYALSICSGFFNDWPRKVTTNDYRASVMFVSSIGTWEFGLGERFSHAEMAGMIAPRPFMVEFGYGDAIALEAWVGFEFAKVRRLYDQLGIGDRATIEFHLGGHEIYGNGTYDFLHRHLNWPEAGARNP